MIKAEQNDTGSTSKRLESASENKDKPSSDGNGDVPQIPCAGKVEQLLDIPANALLTKVAVNIVAMSAGKCPLNEAGEIRKSQGDSKKLIIDLKRMRSVSGLTAPQPIKSIETWTGTTFIGSAIKIKNKNSEEVLFPEVATERLQVTCKAKADLEGFLEKGFIILPDAPVDLIFSVNNKTAWTHLGPVTLSPREKQTEDVAVILDKKAKIKLIEALINKIQDVISGGHSIEDIFLLLSKYDISISESEKKALTDAMEGRSDFNSSGETGLKGTRQTRLDNTFDLSRQAVERWLISLGVTWEGRALNGPSSFIENVDITELLQSEIDAGATPLKLVLHSAFACRLELNVSAKEYLLNHNVIFPAQAQALEITEEGITTLSLPLPGASSSWSVSSVCFTLEGNSGRSRYFPAVGPQATDLGELLLDNDHALAASLTATSLNRFKTIKGVRLPLQVEKEGAEITAFLRKDDKGKVGDYLAEGTLQSQTIDRAEEQWVLMELVKPISIQPDTDLWLEINVIRGKCWWQLGNKNDQSTGVVTLQRGIPGGSFSSFSLTLNGQIENLKGRLRLKGDPVTDGAIHAIVPLDPQSGDELAGITVGNVPCPVELKFIRAVRPADGELNLDLQVHNPGTYTVTEARVLYEV